MQVLITHGSMARTRSFTLSPLKLGVLSVSLVLMLMMFSGAIYHFVFLKAAREGWPVVSQLMRLVVQDEFAQRDRFMRENLDAMAQKVGDLQARLIHLEALSDRLTGMAGVRSDELKLLQPQSTPATTPATAPAHTGQGGLYIPLEHPSVEMLNQAMAQLDQRMELRSDVFTLTESRLFERRLSSMMQPSSRPIEGPVASGFGFRADPFTGHAALHTGLDFPADVGTPIAAAAGGVVISTEWHPQYGNLLEIDHGNGLTTRYAHTSKILVKTGDLIKRGQVVALVGSTGRSTGPHLHFEVLIDGVPQNPVRFLDQAVAAR